MAGTTANSIAVGLTETEAITNLPQDQIDFLKGKLVPIQSIPRDGKPDDVADVIGMLCSRDARWITGSVVNANAGTLYI
jgi:NAD(P)-dependent dehydrogenase (short-subunit alcohol dehydrogenase family)